MTAYNVNELVKLSKTDEVVLDPDQDIRGRKVKDSLGSDLGKVHDLLIDAGGDPKVRAIIVDHGHFLDRTSSAIPVDAITLVTADEVEINQSKDKIVGAPAYDPAVVYDGDYFGSVYDYYGYTPYWSDGYVYTDYPYYV